MDAAAVPFAAGFDWLEGLLPLLFVLYWIGSQLVGLFRAAGGGGRPVVQVPAPPQRHAAEADRAREDLERQIEEFVRQSAGRAGGSEASPNPADREPRRQRRSRSVTPPALPPRPGAAGGRHLGSLQAAGADVAAHVHDAFAHDLGRLAPSRGEEPQPSRAGAAPALDPAELVRNPLALRRLFLLREILDRPVERW